MGANANKCERSHSPDAEDERLPAKLCNAVILLTISNCLLQNCAKSSRKIWQIMRTEAKKNRSSHYECKAGSNIDSSWRDVGWG